MVEPAAPALSTMWMQLRHRTLAEFIEAATALGFQAVELSHVVTEAMLGALPDEAGRHVRVLHHPCPNPGGVPELAATEPEARRHAVAAARRTLDAAAHLGASVVVIHLGEAAVDRRWENALRARWLQGERGTPAFTSLAAHVGSLRAAQAPRNLDAAQESLAALLPHATACGVRLALENGEWVSSLPSP